MTNIKVIEKRGEKLGKTIAILAGVHGNEACGVKAFDKLIPELKIESGKVFFIYANLEAIRQNKRSVEFNLNRCFLKEQSKEIEKTTEGRTVREIMPYLDEADAMLDLHASMIRDSQPFVICDEKQLPNAEIFDSEIASYNWDIFEPGSTDNYMNLQNKPGFCFECGYLGDSNTQKIAENAIKNFLIYTGNISGDVQFKRNQRVLKIKDLYKNKKAGFKKARYFPDFEKFEEKTLLGKEGDIEIYADEGNIVLFIKDQDKLNEECFLLAEETYLNQNSITKSENEVRK